MCKISPTIIVIFCIKLLLRFWKLNSKDSTTTKLKVLFYMWLQITLLFFFLSSCLQSYTTFLLRRRVHICFSWLAVNHINSSKIAFLKLIIAEIPKAKQSMNDPMFTNERTCHQCLKEQIIEKSTFCSEKSLYFTLFFLWLLNITDTFPHYVSDIQY